MSLALTREHIERIAAEGKSGYPHECCGFLLGLWDGSTKRVREVRPVANARSDSPHNRYLIPPEVFLRVEKEARERALDVVGFYHSHPDVEAKPSAFDRDNAWSGYSYVIVSVRAGAPRETRSWELAADRSGFAEETLFVDEPAATESLPPASKERTPLGGTS